MTDTQREADTIALKVSQKIMREVQTMTYPVNVQRMPQLQAKIQCLVAEAITNKELG